jgi:hypothetical protein
VRTTQFENAWVWQTPSISGDMISTQLDYHPEMLEYEASKWQHGNPRRDARDALMEILDVEGYTSELMFGGKHFSHSRHPYFQNLIRSLFDDGELEKLFLKELRNAGLNII